MSTPTSKTRAIVFSGIGHPLVLRSFALPEPGPGEVLVRVSCCTLCGSDVHTLHGRRSVATPTVLGHEILGHICALPAHSSSSDPLPCAFDGRPLCEGDRIVWSVVVGCSHCFFCLRGLPQKCEKLFKYGHEALGDRPLSGGLADHCLLARGSAIFHVPEELPDEVAAPASCATATVSAALSAAGSVEGATVLIQGAGVLGLTACALARRLGAEHVIACDVASERLAWAQRFGATEGIVLNPEDKNAENLRQCIADRTSGRGVDVALECCGVPAAFGQALELVRIGGVIILVGAVFPGGPTPISAERIVRRMLTIRGVHNYTPADLKNALSFLAEAQHEYPLSELVLGRFQLEEAEEAFALASQAGGRRVAVWPGLRLT